MNQLDAYRLLQAGAEALSFVEQAGFCVDTDYCREQIAIIDRKLVRSEHRLRTSKLGRAWQAKYGMKWSHTSVPQLRHVLYTEMRVKPFKKSEDDNESTNEESLRQLGGEVDGIDHLLQLRRWKKARDVLSSFIRYAIDGRMYPSFLLHTVTTYRSSSADPNLQNVPKRDKEIMDICRRALKPSPGHILVEIDFSGIEVAIAATYHKDPTMLTYLNDPKSDMHSDTAKELFILPRLNSALKDIDGGGTLRQASKNGFVFPEFYGSWYEECAFNLACTWLKLPQNSAWRADQGAVFNGRPIGAHLLSHDIDNLDSFTDHVRKVENDFWNRRFRVYNQWRKDWYADYQEKGRFGMQTGFECSGVMLRNQVINYPVQGSAFHILLRTLIKLVAALRGWSSRVIGEIHDSAILDVAPAELDEVIAIAKRIATVEVPAEWRWITVPLRVEVAKSQIDGNWADMEVVA
jgi:DNA polymerase I-like protein with 3'-5' exonuclease and polymerase domains